MIKLVAVKHPEVEIKLIAKKPEVPSYTQGFIDGIGAVFGLGALIAYYFEGCDFKEMSRLLGEAIGPLLGRNLDGHSIKILCP